MSRSALCALTVGAALAGCGQKGPLYLAQPKALPATAPAAAPGVPAASAPASR